MGTEREAGRPPRRDVVAGLVAARRGRLRHLASVDGGPLARYRCRIVGFDAGTEPRAERRREPHAGGLAGARARRQCRSFGGVAQVDTRAGRRDGVHGDLAGQPVVVAAASQERVRRGSESRQRGREGRLPVTWWSYSRPLLFSPPRTGPASAPARPTG